MSSCRRAGRTLGFLAALGAAAGASGCSSDGNGDWGAVFNLAMNSFGGQSRAPMDEVAAIPYSTLGISIAGGDQQVLVLATDNGGMRLWASSARVALTTRYGRIISTAGLDHNLSAMVGIPSPTTWKSQHKFQWTGDFADLGRYSVSVNCTDTPEAAETITILGAKLDTLRVSESCSSDDLDWSFTNTYWVSQDSNRVWRSIQHVSPKQDAIEIEILRPPVSPD